jgi:hypothetical protein
MGSSDQSKKNVFFTKWVCPPLGSLQPGVQLIDIFDMNTTGYDAHDMDFR